MGMECKMSLPVFRKQDAFRVDECEKFIDFPLCLWFDI